MNKVKIPLSNENNENVPEWMKTLENRKKRGHKLAHEIGAGSPCIICQEKCPGLDLHFWRKICRNCKCKKEEHNVQDEDDFEQFEILLGPSKKKKKTLLAFENNSSPTDEINQKPLLFDWIPPNVNDDLAIEYLKQIPASRLPISGSDGALERKRAFERQLPLHDFNADLCHNLSTAETDAQAEYLNNLKDNAVGQATVFKIGAFGNKNLLAHYSDMKMPASQSAHCLGTLNKNPASSLYNPIPKPFIAPSKNENQESIPPPINMNSHPDNLSLKQPSHFIGSPSKSIKLQNEAVSSNQQSQPVEELSHLQRLDANSEITNSLILNHQKGFAKPEINNTFKIQNISDATESVQQTEQTEPLEVLRRFQTFDVNSDLANSQEIIHQKGWSVGSKDSRPYMIPHESILPDSDSFHQAEPNETLRTFQRFNVNPELANSQELQHNKGYMNEKKDVPAYYKNENSNKPLETQRRMIRDDNNPELSNSQQVILQKGNFSQPKDFSKPSTLSKPSSRFHDTETSENLRQFQSGDRNPNPELINSQNQKHQYFAPEKDIYSKYPLSGMQSEFRREHNPSSIATLEDVAFKKENISTSLPLQSQTDPQNIKYGLQNERILSELAHSEKLLHHQGRSSPINSEQENPQAQENRIPYTSQDEIACSQASDEWHPNDNNNSLNLHNNNVDQHPMDSALTRDTYFANNVSFSNAVPTDAMPKAAQLLGQLTLNEKENPDSFQAHPILAAESSEQENVTCAKCNQLFNFGDVAVFADRAGPAKVWHPACFTCTVCNELLADLIYFYYGDTVYCGRHYAEMLNIPRCHACDELIFVKEYTLAEEHAYHYKHFCCLECDQPLGGLRYVPVKDHPVCLDCFQRLYGKKCAKCQQFISPDEKRLQIGSYTWHINDKCFACNNCGKNLVGQRMVLPQGIPYCSKECALQKQ